LTLGGWFLFRRETARLPNLVAISASLLAPTPTEVTISTTILTRLRQDNVGVLSSSRQIHLI
jgi:hypothetical protein